MIQKKNKQKRLPSLSLEQKAISEVAKILDVNFDKYFLSRCNKWNGPKCDINQSTLGMPKKISKKGSCFQGKNEISKIKPTGGPQPVK